MELDIHSARLGQIAYVLTADPPVTLADFLDQHPGDTAHGLAFYRHHRVGHFFNHLGLLLIGEYVLNYVYGD